MTVTDVRAVSAFVDVAPLRKMFRALPVDTPHVSAAVMVAIVDDLGELALVARGCDRITFVGTTSLMPDSIDGAGVTSAMVSHGALKAALAAIGRRKCVELSIVEGSLVVDGVTVAPLHETNISAVDIRTAFDWLTRPFDASAYFNAADVAHTIAASGDSYYPVLATAHVNIGRDPLSVPMPERLGSFAEMASTDRYRLHTARAYLSHGSTDGDRTFNVPVSAIKATMVGKGGLRVEYLPGRLTTDYRARLTSAAFDRKNQTVMTVVTATVTSTASFPAYRDLFPSGARPSQLVVSSDELHDAAVSVARYVKVGRLKNLPLILDVDTNGVTVTVRAADDEPTALEFAPIRINGQLMGAPLRIAFHPQYLADSLAAYVGNGSVSITFDEATRPAVMTLAHGGEETRALLMPVKL